MIYKRFYVRILLQVLLLAITPILFWYALKAPNLVITTGVLGLVWLLQIAYLFYTVNKTNRDLSLFFDAFKYQDSTLMFNNEKNSKVFRPLHKSFNTIITAFGKIRIEREKDFEFFRQTVDLVGIGLLAFDADGVVLLQNKSFHQLFNEGTVKNITELKSINADFPAMLQELKQNNDSQLQKYLIGNKLIKVAVKLVEFSLENQRLKLIAFQDVENVIAEEEMQTMHKLIRVFTHEIVNSVSPIAMLSGTLLKNCDTTKMEANNLEDIQMGLKAIRKRSKGLIAFVDEYKNLTQLPQPKFDRFKIAQLLNDLQLLFGDECKKIGIDFKIEQCSKNQELIGDEKLIIQVLINLVRNAISALEHSSKKQIIVSVKETNSITEITVSDTGCGIDKELLDTIFTPFFTTKKQGSGIGLNLVRQIMRLHKGNVSVSSIPNNLTVFTLRF